MNTLNDLSQVGPYGDHLSDGMVELSFTLPVPLTEQGKRAAIALAQKMGIERPQIVHCQELSPGFSFFAIDGPVSYRVDYEALTMDEDNAEEMSEDQVETFIEKYLGRPVVVVGASTGTDAHTIGLDSILNMKGFDGQHGLEAYEGFKVFNLGGQVPNEVLVARAVELKADVVLVSQTVTQQNLHIPNLTQLVNLLRQANLRDGVVLICGGHGLSNELALELGYDQGFGKGCTPGRVASYLVKELARRANFRSRAEPNRAGLNALALPILSLG